MHLSVFIVLETFVVERFCDIFEMKAHANHIKDAMFDFVYTEIKCSSCRHSGLTRAVLYDIPQYLVLTHKSDDTECVELINEVDLLVIEPSLENSKIDYSPTTVFIVLDNNELFYLRKLGNGLSYYNKMVGQFEQLTDITAQQVRLSTSWVVFVYETQTDAFAIPVLKRTTLNHDNCRAAIEPDVWSIETVLGLIPSFKDAFEVGDAIMTTKEINIILNENGDLNDLIIDGYLSMIASIVPSNIRVLAIPVYRISQMIEKRLK